MLRSGELLAAHRDELFDLDGEHPRFEVPLKRVKKRRVIQQPLSDCTRGVGLLYAGRGQFNFRQLAT